MANVKLKYVTKCHNIKHQMSQNVTTGDVESHKMSQQDILKVTKCHNLKYDKVCHKMSQSKLLNVTKLSHL